MEQWSIRYFLRLWQRHKFLLTCIGKNRPDFFGAVWKFFLCTIVVPLEVGIIFWYQSLLAPYAEVVRRLIRNPPASTSVPGHNISQFVRDTKILLTCIGEDRPNFFGSVWKIFLCTVIVLFEVSIIIWYQPLLNLCAEAARHLIRDPPASSSVPGYNILVVRKRRENFPHLYRERCSWFIKVGLKNFLRNFCSFVFELCPLWCHLRPNISVTDLLISLYGLVVRIFGLKWVKTRTVGPGW